MYSNASMTTLVYNGDMSPNIGLLPGNLQHTAFFFNVDLGEGAREWQFRLLMSHQKYRLAAGFSADLLRKLKENVSVSAINAMTRYCATCAAIKLVLWLSRSRLSAAHHGSWLISCVAVVQSWVKDVRRHVASAHKQVKRAELLACSKSVTNR